MTVSNNDKLKNSAIIALGAMALLFVMSIIFYRERLFADTAFYIFNIINTKSLTIQHQRIGSFITQIVALAAVKLHFPLKGILMAYTVSFNLFFLSIASILFFRLREYGLVILMALYYYLIVSDSYFFEIDEIQQAVGWMFLMLGVAMYQSNRRISPGLRAATFLILATITLFTHFIVLIPTLFLLVYFIIRRSVRPYNLAEAWMPAGMIAAVIAIKFMVSDGQSYEKAHLHHLTHFSLQDIIDSFATPVISVFCQRLLTNYWIAIAIYIAGITVLIKTKQKALLGWTLLSTLGYFILMGLTYGDQDKNVKLFHIESEWQCIGIIIATPFVFEFLPRIKKNFAVIGLISIFVIRLCYIGYSSQAFTWRVHFHERVLAQMKKKGMTKLALYHEDKLNDDYILEWTAPYESLFQSAMDGDRPQLTFIFVNRDEKKILTAISNPKCIFLFNSSLPGEIKDNSFFIDTTRPYEVMSVEQFFK